MYFKLSLTYFKIGLTCFFSYLEKSVCGENKNIMFNYYHAVLMQ